MSDITCARTILDQIGRWTRMSIGARDAVALANGVRFRVGRGRHFVTVTRNALDLYDIDVTTLRGRVVEQSTDLYADQLGEHLLLLGDLAAW